MLSFFYKTPLWRDNWHTMNCTNVMCTIWWVLTQLSTCGTITTTKILKHGPSSKVPSCPWGAQPASPPPPNLQAPTGMISVSTDNFAFPRISRERNHTICILFFAWLFFTQWKYSEMCPGVCLITVYCFSEQYPTVQTYEYIHILIDIGLRILGLSSLFNFIHSSGFEVVSH